MIERAVFSKYLKDLESPDPKYWPVARHELVKLGCNITEKLIKELKTDNPVLRGRIARVLGEIGNEIAVSPLMELLEKDTNSYVCSSAARALGELKNPEATDTLIKKLATKEPKVRIEIARALGELKDKKALEPLKDYYSSARGEERVWAACALVKLGEKNLIRTIEDNLREDVLISAITVAGKLQLKDSIPILLELLNLTGDVKIRIEIIKTLAETNSKEVFLKLKRYIEKCDGEEKIWVIYALSRLGDESKENMIIDVLKKEVRKAAAVALGNIGDKNSAPVLLEALKKEEKDIRYSIVQALGKIRDDKILIHLKEILREETEGHIKLAIEEDITEGGSL